MPLAKDLPYTVHVNGIIQYKRDTLIDIQGEATGKLLDAWKAVKAISFGRKRRRPTNIIPATIKISLETKDEKIARQRWTVAHTAVEALFSAIEEQDAPVLVSLSKGKIELLGELYKSRRLETDDMQRKVYFNQCVEDEDDTTYEDAIEGQLKTLKRIISRSDLKKQAAIAEKALLSVGIKEPRTLPEFKSLVPVLVKAELERLEAINQRNEGAFVDVEPSEKIAHKITDTSLLFSVIQKKFLREQKLSAKRLDDVLFILRDWIDVVGDKNIDGYKKADGRKFKEVLLDLPPNWKKKKATRDLPILKAAAKARKLGMASQSPTTINKKLRAVGQVFTWVIANNDEDILNPVPTGMLVKVPTSAVDDRRPFSSDELTRIIAEISNGKEEHKWIVLIGMFTGARLNEICNLLPTDTLEKDGLRAFSFYADNEERKIKNKASVRTVPLHPMLEELGFLKYAQRMKNRKRLFPSLKPDKYGYLSDGVGDKFNRMLEKLNIKPPPKTRPLVDFHSWRHTFKKHCERCDIRFEHCEAMLGHTLTAMAARYGDRNRYGIKLLTEKLALLEFKDVDFSPLKT